MVTLLGVIGSFASDRKRISQVTNQEEVGPFLDRFCRIVLIVDRLPSRILLTVRGVEVFLFNRTPAYDAIVERMKKHEAEGGGDEPYQIPLDAQTP